MNLELLDPFRRQIPDRIDATLNLPLSGPPPAATKKTPGRKGGRKKKQKEEDMDDDDDDRSRTEEAIPTHDDQVSANHVAFNRRGTYVAVGYGNGTVGIYDMLSRTVSAIYKPQDPKKAEEGLGVTCVSWSRRSRTLVCASASEARVRLVDSTHPSGPAACTTVDSSRGATGEDSTEKKTNGEEEGEAFSQNMALQMKSILLGDQNHDESSFEKTGRPVIYPLSPLLLPTRILETSEDVAPQPRKKREHNSKTFSQADLRTKMHPIIEFDLPLPLASIIQIHPRDITAGFACLNDGSIVAFWAPVNGWWEKSKSKEETSENLADAVKIVTIFKSDQHFVTAAVFDPQGERIYAATDGGTLIGLEVATIFDHLADNEVTVLPKIKPNFTIDIPGGSSVWRIIVSRNGRFIVLSSADGALRLYSTKECWTSPEEVEKPNWVFQDVVTKAKFASCDLSGDAEYVVGLANGSDNKYHLYIWNTSTGTLMDKLTGASVETYSVAWHPTRSFLAVATSDGLIDVWGPRINWTAFAPDFQALPSNVEYVEQEDEFDLDEKKAEKEKEEEEAQENEGVDVVTVEPVPVFASDSEGEDEVFSFTPKVTPRIRSLNNV